MALFGPPNVAKLQAKGNVKGLLKALQFQKNSEVRVSACTALGQIGDPSAVEPLIAALRDRYGRVSEDAAIALGKIGNARAVDILKAAQDPESIVLHELRQAAAEALGQIEVPAVDPRERKIRRIPLRVVRAQPSICARGRSRTPQNPNAWMCWPN